MMVLFWIVLMTVLDGMAAFVGAFTLALTDKTLHRVLFVLVAFSAGTMVGGSMLHLLPESFEAISVDYALLIFIIGFSAFFLIERLLHWRHCHTGEPCEVHTYSYMILFGDGIHNFIDGLVIAAAFVADINLGFIISFLILAHEVPQEIGDFAVLLHGKMKKRKALFYNFLSQLTAVVGGLVGFLLLPDQLRALLLPFAAGGFIYIAASDLIPELHKEPKLGKAMAAFLVFVMGVITMFLMKLFTAQFGVA